MKSFILEKVGKVYDSGCAMLYVNLSLDELHEKIDKDDLTDDGIEDEPHITLLYGLDSKVEIEDVKDALEKIEFGEVNLKKVSMFENEKFDVVKFDVEGEGLQEAFRSLVKLPNTNKYPDYKPHVTIALVKSGSGKKYVDKFKNEKLKAKPMFVVYSPGNDKDKVVISIKKK